MKREMKLESGGDREGDSVLNFWTGEPLDSALLFLSPDCQ